MASIKRKNPPGPNPPPAKSAKATKDSRPAKPDSRPPKPTSAPAPPPSPSKLIREEEPMFPRGGASILTPLEKRDISRQARADVAREHEFGQAETGPEKQPVETKRKRGERKKKNQGNGSAISPEDTVKIQSLNFKNLIQGSLVLAQIVAIRPLELVVALPNNLTGYVSIVNISDKVMQKLQKEAGSTENTTATDDEDGANKHDEDEEQNEDDDDPVQLGHLFRVGQFVRAAVLSTGDSSGSSSKVRHRIDLSLRPSDANAGLDPDDLVANTTVMASVASVEDHGCVMDLGIATGPQAFLPSKEMDPVAGELPELRPGAVMLCMVAKKPARGKVVHLTTLCEKFGSAKNLPGDATVRAFLPGTMAELIITALSSRGMAGKVVGSLDATADDCHSGAGPLHVNLEDKYKVGSRVRVRVICNFPTASDPKIGVSLLPHILSLRAQTTKQKSGIVDPLAALPISSFVDKCTVKHIEDDMGLYVDIGLPAVGGFVHVSRIKDDKVDALYRDSGPYQIGSVHRGRVVGYSALDGIFYLAFAASVLEQKYLRLEDVPVGAVVDAVVERLNVGPEGVTSVIVSICPGITGLVQGEHLADIPLKQPEKKYRDGVKVKARVLSVDLVRRQMRLTLKKTLVNSEGPALRDLSDAEVGMKVAGTIINVNQHGARVKFYGSLVGFLPVSQMSEAYIRDPAEHFRVGRVISVHVHELDVAARSLILTCKDPAAFGLEKQAALSRLRVGDMVSAKITEKREDDVIVELLEGGLKATIPTGHVGDRSTNKTRARLKAFYVGQTLSDCMVLHVNAERHAVVLTMKPSLIKSQSEGTLIASLDDAREGLIVQGFVKNFAPSGVVIGLAGSLHGLLPASRLPREAQALENFGMERFQPITVKIVTVDRENSRLFFWLPGETVDKDGKETKDGEKAEKRKNEGGPKFDGEATTINPVDPAITRLEDVKVGMVTRARIQSVKSTQLNVRIADNIQGRVSMSAVFDDWGRISNPQRPLSAFCAGDIITVRVLGVHDARNHMFLPFSHRSTNSVLELSAKPSDVTGADMAEPLSLDKLEVGPTTYIAFINSVKAGFLWVNLSPSVRGRISVRDATNDLSRLRDLSKSFPVGSALRVRVTSVDPALGRLDLSAKENDESGSDAGRVSWDTILENTPLWARVTKVADRQVIVQLSDTLSAPIHLPDLADNYDEADPQRYKRDEIIRVSIVHMDRASQSIRLSTRPSRVLSSTSPVADPEVKEMSQFAGGDLVRGFVKNISDKGLFVHLGGPVTAMVKIKNLSDRFLKDWQADYQVGQLVRGRVIAVDPVGVELSLKASAVDGKYTHLETYADMKVGAVRAGRVRKVEEFGAFVILEGTDNVSGLCHRSNMADAAVPDARRLYSEGDLVKAKILAVDTARRRLDLGLKPSLFEEEDSDLEMGTDANEDGAGVALAGDDQIDGARLLLGGAEDDQDDSEDDDDAGIEMTDAPPATEGLAVSSGKYDWTADPFDWDQEGSNGEDGSQLQRSKDAAADEKDTKKEKKRRRAEMDVDRTAELDARGPQTASDYERLLLGQPDSSALWIAYMAFQIRAGELGLARAVAERAVRSVNPSEEAEKLNAWTAFLNLEVTYGTQASAEEVFERACQYNDGREMHERLASIYIQAGKHESADALFESMLKSFGSTAPEIWLNYGHFLHVTLAAPTRARALLTRAMRALEQQHHVAVVARFGALEFRSPNGSAERGRTLFEGLLDRFPKRGDLWGQLLDLEMGAGAGEGEGEEENAAREAAIRDVLERRTRARGLKPRQAMKWFRRWSEWEEWVAGSAGRDRVLARTQEWVRAYKEKHGGEE